MPIVKTHDLKPGAILAKGVQNHSGRKLLPEGTLITDQNILSLKAWGITEADVLLNGVNVDSTPPAEKIDLEKLAQAENKSEALFYFSNRDHPAVIELMRLSSLHRLKKMQEKGRGDVDVK